MSNLPSLIHRQAVLDGVEALRQAGAFFANGSDEAGYANGFAAGFSAALRAVEVGLGAMPGAAPVATEIMIGPKSAEVLARRLNESSELVAELVKMLNVAVATLAVTANGLDQRKWDEFQRKADELLDRAERQR